MEPKYILVADDERNMLHTLKFILEAANYKVSTVTNGRNALERILAAKNSSQPVDLLITDIQMPGLTGMQLIDELHSRHINIPVFVITGHGNRQLVVELKQKGCEEYLDKPFDEEELIRRVSALLEEAEKEP